MRNPGILCLAFAALALGTHAAEPRAARTVTLSQPTSSVARFDYLEVTLNVAEPVAANPFRDVNVTASFGPTGQPAVSLDGFCDSNDGTVFRVRFTPRQTGAHSYTITYEDAVGTRQFNGTFQCTAGTLPGFLRVDPAHPLHFIWEGTGEHFYHVGNTAYAILGLTDEAEIRRNIDYFRDKGVNKVRLQNYARMVNGEFGASFDATWNGNLLVFQGSDHTRYNLPQWRKTERLLRYMRDRNMIASVIMVIDRGRNEFPAAGSANEDLYYRYAVARYAAFSNVTFDLGNEHNEYRSVPSWANRLGALIKQWNPYDNLTSAHAYETHAYKNAPGTEWCDWQIFQHYGSVAQMNQWIIDNRNAPQPAVNEEYGYEGTNAAAGGHNAIESTVRRHHWAIALAGGYGTYGDYRAAFVTGKIGPGKVLSTGALKHLGDFFAGRSYWAMSPDNARVNRGFCLSRAGSEYLVYLPDGGTVAVNLSGVSGNFAASWFNPRTGQSTSAGTVAGGGSRSLSAPSTDDWALSIVASTSPPVASFSATPTSGTAPLAVAFDASASSEPGGSITSYAWVFGDGASGSGRTVSHTYSAAGDYTAHLTVTGSSGLTASATRTITVSAADTTPPVISGVQVLDVTSNSARVVWTTNEAASSQAEYGPTSSYGSTVPVDPALVTAHSVQITGLSPSTLYHVRARSADAAGNEATSPDLTFATLGPDVTPPIITNVAVAFTGGGAQPATFTWSTDEPSTSQVEYGPTTAYGSLSTLDAALVTSHSVAENDFVSGATYHYRVRSRDSAGNESVSGNFSFVYPDGGGSPPQITAPATASLSPGQTVTAVGSGTNLSWSVDRIGDGLPAFAAGSGSSITFTVPADSTSAQTIEITLTGDGGTDTQTYSIVVGPPPPPATTIDSPGAGANFSPGEVVTATGSGQNLSWSVDRIGDGLPAFATGSGSSITFTVPADSTSAQTIEITLTGDGGTDTQTHGINASGTLVSGLLVGSTLSYEWTTLLPGELLYTDRNYTFLGPIPGALDGQLLLRTANDDKFSDAGDPSFLSFTVNEDVTVFVLYTNVNTTLESGWLSTWAPEAFVVATTLPGAEADREVRSRSYPSGSTVELGGNGATDGMSSMYHVVVVPGTVPSTDSDGDGIPDAWETQFGLDPSDPADAAQDLDGDGMTNLEEYQNGTDPTVPGTAPGAGPAGSTRREGSNGGCGLTGFEAILLLAGFGMTRLRSRRPA